MTLKIPCMIGNIIRYVFPTFQLHNKGNLLISRDCFLDNLDKCFWGKTYLLIENASFMLLVEIIKVSLLKILFGSGWILVLFVLHMKLVRQN